MAKTFLAGEAAVRLIPHAGGFHLKARRELAKDKLHVGVELKPDITGFTRDARAKLKTVKGLRVDVKLTPDVSGFRREASAKLAAGRPLKVGVTLEARADNASVAAAHAGMQAQLRAMGPLHVDVEIRSSLDEISAHHVAMQSQLTALGPLRVQIEADRDRGMFRRGGGLLGGGRGGGGGGRGGGGGLYSKLLNTAIIGGAIFGPIATQAAVGGLAALTAAAGQALGTLGLLPAVVTAAGAGFAALGIAASGLAGAFSAIKEQSAAAPVADNSRGVASAARQVDSAHRGLARAHREVARAQETEQRAQQDLNKARKRAVRDLRDMNDELRKAPINEKQAALAIRQAQQALADAYKGGDALEIEGARLDVEEAKVDYDILKKQNQDLAADTREANLAGVEGAEEVVEAKLAVRDANDAVSDAQEGVKDAADALTAALEAQQDALKGTAGGVDKVAQAMAKLSPNAQDFVRKMQALGPMWTDLRKAVQDRFFLQLGDDVTTLAQRQLPNLRWGLENIAFLLNRGVREALTVFSTPKAMRDFQTTLGNFAQMYSGIADSFGPLSSAFIDVVTVGSEYMPRFGQWISKNAEEFAISMAKAREDGSMQDFFDRSIEAAKQLGRIFANLGHALGDFFAAGQDTGGGFLDTLETITGELRRFTESVEGQEAMKEFFTGVGEAVRTLAPILSSLLGLLFGTLGPMLTDFVTGLGPGLTAVFEGLRTGLEAIRPVMQPLGEAIGGVLTVLGQMLAQLGPILARAIDALMPALQPMAELFSALVLAVAPLLPVIAQVVTSLVQALAPALTKIVQALAPVITTFLEGMMPAIGPIADALGQLALAFADVAIELINALLPHIPTLTDLFTRLILAVIPILPAFGEMAKDLLPPLIGLIGDMIPILTWLLDKFVALVEWLVPVLIPVLGWLSDVFRNVMTWIADAMRWAWNEVLKPILGFLGDELTDLGNDFSWLWDNVIKPVIDNIAAGWDDLWNNYLKGIFSDTEEGIDSVGEAFKWLAQAGTDAINALASGVSTPIRWIIDNVINGGIGKGWKAVDDFLGGTLPDWKDVPPIGEWNWRSIGGLALGAPGMARGGEVPMEPGAVAGRDSVLRNLMPGEIVMSLPAVRALGAENLLAANAAAQRGGVAAQGMFPVNVGDMASRIRRSQYGMEDGGIVRPDDPAFLALKRGMEWAASRDGRPYVLGGSADGSGGTDCSGFMSGIADVILGGNGARQWATMAFNGGGNAQYESGPQGFAAGLAAGFNIGVLNGGPAGGHTAGTFTGIPGMAPVNVESGGSHGYVAYGGPATGADNSQFPTKYHLPIVGGEFVSAGTGGGGGSGPSREEAQRRGITREAEKLLNGVLDPVRDQIKQFAAPPHANLIPALMADKLLDPITKKVLDEVSALTSVSGWRDRLAGTLDAMNPSSWFDEGGIANGTGYLAKNTIEPERVLSPYETKLFESLLQVLGMFGIKHTPKPIPVEVEEWPTTADRTGRGPLIEGEAYGQPLQGAAIDPNTGEYLPANNVPSGTGTDPAPRPPLFTETPEWKVARSLAAPFGFDAQMGKIEEKAPMLAQIGEQAMQAAPAYAAALAGDPTQLATRIAETTTAWATKTTADVAAYLPEAAGGMAESALSMLASPLIGTVNTGMSQAQLVETMEDVQNRKRRRTKTGRSRR